MLKNYQEEILKEIYGVMIYKGYDVELKNEAIIVSNLNRSSNEEAFNLMENFCYIIANENKIENKVHFFENGEDTLRLSFINQ